MRHHPASGFRAALLTVAFALPAACTESPTIPPAPSAAAASVMSAGSASGFSVVHLHLRTENGGELNAWGEQTVFVGVLHPPNPCLTAVQDATLIVCGVIHNPEAQLLTGGALIVQATRDGPRVQLALAVPPNPCLTYLVRAAGSPDLGAAGLLTLPAVQAVFTFERGSLVGAHPGGVNLPAGGRQSGEQADAPPNPCIIGFEAQRTG